MNDRELLELAAKAAGNGYKWADPDGVVKGGLVTGITGCTSGCEFSGEKCRCDPFAYWNPLTDDGDALRLAVKVLNWPFGGSAFKNTVTAMYALDQLPKDPYAATRRAIVRAAAEIGKEMK